MTDPGRPAVPAQGRPDPLSRLGRAIWGLLTSVDFAVIQIIVLVVMGVVGMVIRQLPAYASRTPADHATAMDAIHARYDPSLGAGLVGLLERAQVFQVFSSWWFSAALVILTISIVCCTLNRTPRMWRQAREIRVIQPDPFHDPRLPDRAALDGLTPEAVHGVLRANRFAVRSATAPDGTVHLYGDRHRWTTLATLFTHTGLVLFLVAAAVTSRLGFESGILLATGESQPVTSIGAPGLLVVKSFGFEAPRRADGSFADFTTDLAVYRDGQELVRKVIRVNDPLSVAGYTFHQNGFLPAPDLVIRDAKGALLWDGPYALTDSVASQPHGLFSVPGREVGLEMLLTRAADGTTGILFLPYRALGTLPDGSPNLQNLTPFFVAVGGVGGSRDTDFSVQLRGIEGATVLVAKRDPGQGLVWLAFGCLITGLLIVFYLPRRRVWARLDPTGRLSVVGRSDRYVDFEREFGRLLEDLVAARRQIADGGVLVGGSGAG
jgi:cytochrome c biogenesis protein